MITFNTILRYINTLVLILIVYSLFVISNNPYIDEITLLLGILLSIQTHLALIYEKAYNNPFVILFTFYTILYYSLRLFTLTIYPESHVFDRFTYDVSDSNFSMIYIIISNIFLYFGFFMIKTKDTITKKISCSLFSSTFMIYLYMLIILTFMFLLKNTSGLLGFMNLLFSHQVAIPLLLIYYIVYHKRVSKTLSIGIVLFVLIIIIYVTLSGSRSGIVSFIEAVIVVLLATKDKIYFSKKKFYLLISIVPILITVLYFTYALATFNRAQGSSKATISKSIEYAISSSDNIVDNNHINKILSHIAGRIGYFDFSSEIIAHNEEYDDVFNLSSYLKSVIDNILTPGFDLFDQPKISNSLVFIYKDYGVPKKSLVSQMYQSDQLGIHGELYALFGYSSVVIFFILSYLFSYMYNNISNTNLYMQNVYKYFLLYLFISVIKSFGIDWVLLYSFVLFISLQIHSNMFFKYKFKIKGKKCVE